MSEQNERPVRSGLSALAIRRPVFTTMLMLGLMVLGIFGYRRLPIDQFPPEVGNDTGPIEEASVPHTTTRKPMPAAR